jgi:putative transposase
MDPFESLNHTKWDCKYHVVFIPKYRRKALYGELKRHLGAIFRQLAEQRESRVEEGHLMPDQVHMLLAYRRNMRSVRWLNTSKARAQSILRELTANPSAGSSDKAYNNGLAPHVASLTLGLVGGGRHAPFATRASTRGIWLYAAPETPQAVPPRRLGSGVGNRRRM